MRSGRTWIALLLALVLSTVPLFAMAEGGVTVTIGQVSEVANLNPTLYPRTPDSNVQCLIFDGLIKPQSDLSFGPSLAESWDVSEDGTLYTFHLRKDVTWHAKHKDRQTPRPAARADGSAKCRRGAPDPV